jgi:hypothetical protein
MRKAGSGIIIFVFLSFIIYSLVSYWPYIFSKKVEGNVVKVEKLMDPIAVMTGGEPSNKVFSFAVAIRNESTGEIFTASTEDRQWAAVQGEGLCAEAKFFPYPPWKLDKSGTYFGARLIKLWNCTDKKPE